MNVQELLDTAKTLVASENGPLAMDASNSSCNKRLVGLGILPTEEARRASMCPPRRSASWAPQTSARQCVKTS